MSAMCSSLAMYQIWTRENMEKMSRQKLDNINRNKMRLFQKCERYVGPDKDMMFEILCDNKDWIPYLPPNNETFFSILGLDRNLLSGDKRDIETIIR